MRDHLTKLALQTPEQDRLNICREYLQSYLLSIMQKYNFFQQAAFVGGTSLRIIYNLPRFSEDLDFSLVKPARDKFDLKNFLEFIKKELELSGYTLTLKYKDQTAVLSAMLGFNEISYELGISDQKDQKLSIKIDLDTNPPAGAVLATKVINKFIPLALCHYDQGSLLAGKINALLTRGYSKGRDYFDLFWLLTKGITPNLEFLNNALLQFNYPQKITAVNWRDHLKEVIGSSNFNKVLNDVIPFLEYEALLNSFNKENLLKVLD